MALDYLAHLREDSARFAAVLRDAPDRQVPTCPAWRTDDLLWHLAEVQWFWGTVVRENVTEPPSDLPRPARPGDRPGLVRCFDTATRELQIALADTAPSEARWTWADDHTAGFVRRRQAHEALIHRVDAELTADVARAPMDPELATDGVDEALRVMFGAPGGSGFEPEPDAVLLARATDTGRAWKVTLGRSISTVSGAATGSESVIQVQDATEEASYETSVEGQAADLDCWLWGRPTIGALHRTGDDRVHSRFQELIGQGID